jgi:hypothetical protein
LDHAQIAASALVYGLARMAADGHFPEWNLRGQPTSTMMGDTLDFFIAMLGGTELKARQPPQSSSAIAP